MMQIKWLPDHYAQYEDPTPYLQRIYPEQKEAFGYSYRNLQHPAQQMWEQGRIPELPPDANPQAPGPSVEAPPTV